MLLFIKIFIIVCASQTESSALQQKMKEQIEYFVESGELYNKKLLNIIKEINKRNEEVQKYVQRLTSEMPITNSNQEEVLEKIETISEGFLKEHAEHNEKHLLFVKIIYAQIATLQENKIDIAPQPGQISDQQELITINLKLQEKIVKLDLEHNQLLEQLNEQIQHLHEANVQSAQTIEEQRTNNLQLTEKIKELELNKNQLQQKLNGKLEEIDLSKSQPYSQTVSELEDKCEKLQQENQELTSNFNTLKHDVELRNEADGALRLEIAKLRDELKKQTGLDPWLETQIIERIPALENESRKLHAKNEGLQKNIQKLKDKMHVLQLENEELKKKIRTLPQDRDHNSGDEQEAQQENLELIQELNNNSENEQKSQQANLALQQESNKENLDVPQQTLFDQKYAFIAGISLPIMGYLIYKIGLKLIPTKHQKKLTRQNTGVS